MSKNKKLGYIISAIAFVLFNVIAFAIPTDKTSVFWISYTFTLIAFAVQILIWNITLSKADNLKSKFLGLPIIYVGIIYFVIQLIAFGAFLALPWIANWIPIVICAVILGVSSKFLMTTEVGKEEVARVEAKVQQKVSLIKGLQADVELIAEVQIDVSTKEVLEALVEKLKYSDPMSDELLAPVEQEIGAKITSLKTQSLADIFATVKQIEMLLLERNKKVKMLKAYGGRNS